MQIPLFIISGSFQLIAAVLGAYMSGRRHPAWFVVFIAVGLSGLGATTWQAVLSVKSADETKVLLHKISDDLGAFSGHPIDGASLESIQRGISELKTIVKPKPWWLTPEQISLLTKRMAPFADGTNREDLVNVLFWDSESTRLAFDLVNAFRAAGWDLPEKGLNIPDDGYHKHEPGLYLLVRSQAHTPKGLSELARTLREAGIDPTTTTDETIPEGQFRILVAARPNR